MTQALATQREGHAFQARIFWRKALCLLDPSSPVIRVGFESGPKGFDDVWVEYDQNRAPIDFEGKPIRREHIQCKWHVSINDFGYTDLVNPEWINANRFSLLQRAHKAQLEHAKDGTGARFKLLTNWRVGQNDLLRPLIHQRSKNLRLDQLFGTKTDASAAGRIRKLWREHLGLDDRELRIMARTLAIDTDSTSLEDHRENLDTLFEMRGLRRVPLSESSFIYDDIVFQWLAQGRLEFNRSDFREACRSENLLVQNSKSHVVFGVKSFEHAFDRLEDRCTKVLDLITHFDERMIRNQQEWTSTLYPKLKEFLQNAARNETHLRLILDAHITLAFAAGTVLNIKSGRSIEIEQRSIIREVWHNTDMPSDANWPSWQFDVVKIGSQSGELAVAVSLTHDITPAVKTYIGNTLPGVGTLLTARPSCGPGARSVACGQHAFELAEKLAQRVNAERAANAPPLHLFIAAPNGFTFFLGQRQPGLGKTILYEYDFEGNAGGSYQASLTLPF